MLETVPSRFRQDWAQANFTVYANVDDTLHGPEAARDDALEWELILHKLLLRKPPRSRGPHLKRCDVDDHDRPRLAEGSIAPEDIKAAI